MRHTGYPVENTEVVLVEKLMEGDKTAFETIYFQYSNQLKSFAYISFEPGYETMVFTDEVKGRDKRLQQTIRTDGYTRINAGVEVPAPSAFTYTYTGYQPIKLSNGTQGKITWLSNIPREWEEKNYLYPIPETDLLTNPALGQNPGWN